MDAKRFNEDKVDFTLNPIDALEAEARVWMMGEKKYGRSNWEKLWGDRTVEVVMQSALRHCNAIIRGEDIDEESGQPHAAHVRCNMAMLIRYLNNNSKEGTPTKPILPEGFDPDMYKDFDRSILPTKGDKYVITYPVDTDRVFHDLTVYNKTRDRHEFRVEGFDYGC